MTPISVSSTRPTLQRCSAVAIFTPADWGDSIPPAPSILVGSDGHPDVGRSISTPPRPQQPPPPTAPFPASMVLHC